MALVGLLDARNDFWAEIDASVLSMSADRHSRLEGAQYRQLAETARATWAQAEIQHASLQLLDIQCRQLNEINGTLSATFNLLANTNTQLAEANEHLRGLRATQDEHLLLIKKERTLKEVIFQLGGLIDSAVNMDDAVSAFAYHRYSLATLDRYQLGTADLSGLEDKKEFDRFIKNSRGVVRNAINETIQSLEDFEATCLLYHKRLEVGVVHDIPRKQQLPVFIPGDIPLFAYRDAPVWEPLSPPSPPVFVEREPPSPRSLIKELDDLNAGKPVLRLPKCPVGFGPDGPIKGRTPPQPPDALLLPKGYVPPSCENTPTQAETDARFPPRPMWAAIAYPKEILARKYEASLRSWKAGLDSYTAWKTACEDERLKHEKAHALWLQERKKHEEKERYIREVEYPPVLRAFEEEEEKRRAEFDLQRVEYEERRRAFDKAEEARRADYDRDLEQFHAEEDSRKAEMRSTFELAERQRFDGHLAEWRRLKDANANLEKRLQQAVTAYENAIAAYGRLINEYLDEHSDLQVFYCKVNPVADLAKYRRDWKKEAFGNEEAAHAVEEPTFCAIDCT